MKRKILWSVPLIVLIAWNGHLVNAQGLYAGAGVGYGLSANTQSFIGIRYSLFYPYSYSPYVVNSTTNLSDSLAPTGTVQVVKGSLGKGLQYGVHIGYMFTPYIGAELGLSFLSGSQYDAQETETDHSLKHGTVSTSVSAKMTRLVPSLCFEIGDGKVKPYMKVGAVIGISGTITNHFSSSTTDTLLKAIVLDETFELTGGISFGFASSIGLKYIVSDKISLFGELNMISQTWAPDNGHVTAYSENGANKINNLTIAQQQTVYDDSFSVNDNLNGANPSIPTKVIKNYLPLSSFGINIGINFKF